jgi:hypothetical protein
MSKLLHSNLYEISADGEEIAIFPPPHQAVIVLSRAECIRLIGRLTVFANREQDPFTVFTRECAGKFEALTRRWESRLDALYQAATPPTDAYRYWFGEVDRNASDTMRQIARQNGFLKLHEALLDRIQGGEWPAEMLDLQAWSQQADHSRESISQSVAGTASQDSQPAGEAAPCGETADKDPAAQPLPFSLKRVCGGHGKACLPVMGFKIGPQGETGNPRSRP